MLDKLKETIHRFVKERDWDQFHSPKNLAINLSIEASELLEHFTWLDSADIIKNADTMREIREEIGDVMISLMLIADKLGIDLIDATFNKIEVTAKKYPIELCKGNSAKYYKLKNASRSD